MNLRSLLGLLLGPLLSLFLAASPLARAEAEPAPAFTLSDGEKELRLEDFKGKVVYLDFWASWCGPCRQSFPWMNDLQEKYRDRDLVVIAVNLDARREDARKFLDRTPVSFRVAFDAAGATPRLYKVKGMPASFVIGRDGRILRRHTGFREEARADLEAAIQAAL